MRVVRLMLAVLIVSTTIQAGNAVQIESVSNSFSATSLQAGSLHTIRLRVVNDSDFNFNRIENWFRISSPDGANFGPVSISSVGSLNGTSFDSLYTTQVINGDGFGADTIHISGIANSGAGLAGLLNEVVWEISFVSRLADAGKQICIDRVELAESAGWKWYHPLDSLIPTWTDGRCMQIALAPPPIPVFTNCPSSLQASHCDTVRFDFNADYECCISNLRYRVVSGGGLISELSGVYSNKLPSSEVGSFPVVVQAYDFLSPGQFSNCAFTIDLTNAAPIAAVDSQFVSVRPDTTRTIFVISDDPDQCDFPLTRTAVHLNGGTGTLTYAPSGALSYQMSVADSLRADTIRVAAISSDGLFADTAMIGFHKFGCCGGIRQNPDCSPGDLCDIGDVTYMVGYLFLGSPTELCCPEEANTDGIGNIDIADLIFLVGYLFLSGTQPASCF